MPPPLIRQPKINLVTKSLIFDLKKNEKEMTSKKEKYILDGALEAGVGFNG